ncbi:MAG TPA: RNA methyltransferase [Candidatus Pacearchaeota archaeon]|nr:RNA methyltransferase [Candidatus Pacearchaeota archaeon]
MATQERIEKIKNVMKKRQEGIIVFENISDPHNAHASFRSCEAFGFGKIYLVFDGAQDFNPKNTGKLSSSSARDWLDFKIFKSAQDCVNDLKENGYKIIGTSLDADSISLSDANFLETKIAIVFGNERNGISQTFNDACDQKIKIPMKGMVQSLNLSVSAGIILWEITRQRQKQGEAEFLLKDQDSQSLKNKFISQ